MRDYTAKELRDSGSFLTPLFLFILLFIFVPVAGTIVTSLFQDISFTGRKFILFGNYSQMLTDSGFWRSLRFTMLFILFSVPIELALGVAFALILDRSLPLRGLLRAAVLIPWAIPAAISARTWELVYNYSYGLANYIVIQSGLSTDPVNWLGTSAGAFAALVLSDAWKTTPFVAIIILAGLQAIPDELHKQAQIDRASFIRRFFKITLPLLRPILIVALIFRTIDALRIFDLVYVLTGGGPGGATASLSLYGYKHFLAGDFGYGSAVSVVLFVIAFALSIIYVKSARFGEVLS